MSKRGKDLLLAIGMKPKGGSDDEEAEGEDSGSDYEPDDAEIAAAEELCRALDVDEGKASEVAKAICAIVDCHKGG